MKLKYIRIAAINWNEEFTDVNGSYYDRVASISAGTEDKEIRISAELIEKGWREIPTSTGTRVFLKDRHIVRLFPLWR